jgi:hypothetical protein
MIIHVLSWCNIAWVPLTFTAIGQSKLMNIYYQSEILLQRMQAHSRSRLCIADDNYNGEVCRVDNKKYFIKQVLLYNWVIYILHTCLDGLQNCQVYYVRS